VVASLLQAPKLLAKHPQDLYYQRWVILHSLINAQPSKPPRTPPMETPSHPPHDPAPTDWKHDGVRVVPGDQLDGNVPSTPGMDRKAAINFARVGAQKL